MEFWGLLFKFVPTYKGRIFSYILLIVLSSIFSIFSFATIIPLLQLLFGISESKILCLDFSSVVSFKTFLDYIENNALFFLQDKVLEKGSIYPLFIIALFLIITSALSNIISYLAYYVRIPIRTGISRDLRNKVYDKILFMKYGKLSLEKKGDFISRMTSDIEEVDNGIGTAMDMLIKEPIKIIVYILTLFGISLHLTLEALLLLVVSCSFITIVGAVMKRLALQGQQCRSLIISTFEETIEKLRLVRTYGLGESFYQNFVDLSDKTMNIFNKTNRWYSIAWPLTDFLLTTNIALLMLLGGVFILNESSDMPAERFLYFLVVFFSIIPPIRNITKATYGIRKAMASVDRMNYILSIEKEKLDSENNIHEITNDGKDIVFRDVSFGYTSDNIILKEFNISIPLRRFTILKGNIGVGKTTIFNLLLKLFTPNKGTVSICGYDINELSSKCIRDLITYVPQNPELFNASILDNIRLSNKQESIENIKRYAEFVGIDDYIESLPMGYNTIVGDHGMNLSSGQKQSISLIRALLRDTPILVLDESTNCMDLNVEIDFFEKIRKNYPSKTIVLITHNDDLNQFADNIITLH